MCSLLVVARGGCPVWLVLVLLCSFQFSSAGGWRIGSRRGGVAMVKGIGFMAKKYGHGHQKQCDSRVPKVMTVLFTCLVKVTNSHFDLLTHFYNNNKNIKTMS